MIDMDDVVDFCSNLMMAAGFLAVSVSALFLVVILGALAWAVVTDAPLPAVLRCNCTCGDQSYVPLPPPGYPLGIR